MEHAQPLARVLIVDDDVLFRKMVGLVLTESGYEVAGVDGASAAMRLLEREEVHLIVLDVGMAGMSGPEFCKALRAQGRSEPVLFLSGHKDLLDKLEGFGAGGDDYLVKPFEPRELLVRVRALLSRQIWRTGNPASGVVRYGGLFLDVANLTVRLPDNSIVSLTPTELSVLQYLMFCAGRVATRDLIRQAGWGYNYESSSNQVDVYIRRIRRKIERSGTMTAVQTVRSIGYRLVVDMGVTSAPEPAPAGR